MTAVILPSVQVDAVFEDTLDATQATLTGSATAPFDLSPSGGTLSIDIDGDGAQPINLTSAQFSNLATATAEEVAAAINTQLVGGVATAASSALVITSNLHGSGSSVEISAGTMQTALGLSTSAVAGVDASTQLFLANRVPEPLEKGVSLDAPINFDVVANSGTAPTSSNLDVFVDGVQAVTAGVGSNGYAALVTTPFAGTLRTSLTPPANLVTNSIVTVQVTVAGSPNLDSTYTFVAGDTAAPLIVSAQARSSQVVRITFDEDVRQNSATSIDDALNPANYTFERLTRPAVAIAATSVSSVSDDTVDVSTDIEMSYAAPYMAVVANGTVSDLAGNSVVAPANTANFEGFAPTFPLGRRFRLWDWIPNFNKAEDSTRELEVFIAVLQEVANLLLSSIDRWVEILDPDTAPEDFLDAMLFDLGNPFQQFELSVIDKRRLLRVLVDIYKSKGTAQGIIDVVRFFLGLEVTIEIFNGVGWELASWDTAPVTRTVISFGALSFSSTVLDLGVGMLSAGPEMSANSTSSRVALLTGNQHFDIPVNWGVSGNPAPSGCSANVYIDANDVDIARHTTAHLTASNTTPQTVSVEMGTYNTLLLFVYADVDSITMTATYDGAPLTLLDSDTFNPASGNDDFLFVYELSGIAGTTGDLVVTSTSISAPSGPGWIARAVKTSHPVSSEISFTFVDSPAAINDTVNATSSTIYSADGDFLNSSGQEAMSNPVSLGPDTSGIYSFRINTSVILTDTERERITEIAEYMKPAHTHLIDVVDGTPAVPTDHMELGVSELGGSSGPGTFILHGGEAAETTQLLDFSTAAILIRPDFGVTVNSSNRVTYVRNLGTYSNNADADLLPPSNGPTYLPAGTPANTPAFFFNAANSEALSTTLVDVPNPVTIFAAVRIDDVTNTTVFDGGATNRMRLYTSGVTDAVMFAVSQQVTTPTVAAGTWVVYACQFNPTGTDSILKVNTTSTVRGDLDTSSGTGYILGARNSSSPLSPFLDGALGHFSMFFEALTEEDMDRGIVQIGRQLNITVA